jgi:hypothetical protein
MAAQIRIDFLGCGEKVFESRKSLCRPARRLFVVSLLSLVLRRSVTTHWLTDR